MNTHTIKFSKMHGLGNDFVVINAIDQIISLENFPMQQLANRYTGIGFDQLLIIKNSQQADFACRIFNSDGSEAKQCGNGLRAVARFIHDEKLSTQNNFTIETIAGIFDIVMRENDTIQVTMGTPEFALEKVPFVAAELDNFTQFCKTLIHPLLSISLLSMGNPHVIIQVESLADFPVALIGQPIATHPAFTQGTNVGFMECVDRQHIRLRTFERGVGETFACGSNACAAVVAGITQAFLDTQVSVELALGNLWIEWQGKPNPVIMTGPATHVFNGVITL